MRIQSLKVNSLLFSITILLFTVGLAAPPAFAAPGDFLTTVTFDVQCPSGLGVGIAMDGTDLWYSCFGAGGNDLKRADAITGIVEYEIDIVANGGLGALSYDATRDVIWAGDGGGTAGGEVYKIQLTGPAGSKTVSSSSLEFNVAADVGICGLDDGLAFDARNVADPNDDRLYYSNDCGQTTTIRTYTLQGVLDESFQWAGNAGYNSGLAIGGQLLIQGSNGASHVWVVDKTTKVLDFDFPTNVVAGDPNFRDEDLECDTVTLSPIHIMWSKEANAPMRAHAFEFKQNECGIGGIPPPTLVGGQILPIDSMALIVAGSLTNVIWMAPILAGAAGVTAFYLKSRKK